MSDKPQPVLPALLRSTALLLIYFLSGVLFKKSLLLLGQVTLFWPLAGLALSAILILGYRFTPIITLGAFIFLWAGGVPLGWFMVITSVGNTLIAAGLVWLLKRFLNFENAQERLRDVVIYLLLVCGFGAALNAAVNAAGLACENKISWEALLPNMLARWIPNALAVLVLPPFFIVWTSRSLWQWNYRKVAEAVCCAAGLIASTLVAFNTWFVYGIHNYPLVYLPVPFLLWGRIPVRPARRGHWHDGGGEHGRLFFPAWSRPIFDRR